MKPGQVALTPASELPFHDLDDREWWGEFYDKNRDLIYDIEEELKHASQ